MSRSIEINSGLSISLELRNHRLNGCQLSSIFLIGLILVCCSLIGFNQSVNFSLLGLKVSLNCSPKICNNISSRIQLVGVILCIISNLSKSLGPVRLVVTIKLVGNGLLHTQIILIDSKLCIKCFKCIINGSRLGIQSLFFGNICNLFYCIVIIVDKLLHIGKSTINGVNVSRKISIGTYFSGNNLINLFLLGLILSVSSLQVFECQRVLCVQSGSELLNLIHLFTQSSFLLNSLTISLCVFNLFLYVCSKGIWTCGSISILAISSIPKFIITCIRQFSLQILINISELVLIKRIILLFKIIISFRVSLINSLCRLKSRHKVLDGILSSFSHLTSAIISFITVQFIIGFNCIIVLLGHVFVCAL